MSVVVFAAARMAAFLAGLWVGELELREEELT